MGWENGWKGSLLILEWLPRSRCCHCVTYDLGRQQLSKLRNSWYRNKVACFMTFEEKKNLNCEAMCETCYINSNWHQSQPSWKIRLKSHRCTNSIRIFLNSFKSDSNSTEEKKSLVSDITSQSRCTEMDEIENWWPIAFHIPSSFVIIADERTGAKPNQSYPIKHIGRVMSGMLYVLQFRLKFTVIDPTQVNAKRRLW